LYTCQLMVLKLLEAKAFPPSYPPEEKTRSPDSGRVIISTTKERK